MSRIAQMREKMNFEKIYFYIVLTFALALPIAKSVSTAITLLLPLLWLFEGDFKRKIIQIKSSRVLLAIFAWIAIMFLSLIWTENLSSAKDEIRIIFYYLSIFVIATSLNPKYTQKIINSFLLGMSISIAIAYGVFFELWEFKKATPQNPAPFMSHLQYSVFLAFCSIMLLNMVFSSFYNLKYRVLYFCLFVASTGNLFLSTGRSGQVAFMIALVVMSFLKLKLSLKSLLLSLLLVVSIFTSAFYMSYSFQLRALQAKSDIEKVIINSDYTTSLGIRAAYWITTYNILKENPLLGVGIGDFRVATTKELENKRYDEGFNKSFMSINAPHNQYLLILLQTGLIGFGIFLYFIYKFITLYIENKSIKELSVLFAVIIFITFLTNAYLLNHTTRALFIMFCGIFIANAIFKPPYKA